MRLGLAVAAFVVLAPLFVNAQTVQPATPVDRPAPDYPDAVGDFEGYVKLHFTVDKTGHVTDVQPFESSPQGVFDAAAIEALSHWSYHPRTVDGKPAEQPGNSIMLRFKPSPTRPPVWLNPRPTFYPREAFDAKIEGSAIVGYDIDERGMVSNVHVLSSTSEMFDKEAADNVRNRVFQPMMVDGKPVPDTGLTTTIDFKLANAKIARKVVHIVNPKYPADAEQHGSQGYCAVDFTVTPDGSTADPKITMSFPSGVFEKSVLTAIQKWKFEPAWTMDGPVATRAYYAFTFEMGNVPEGATHYLDKGQWIKLDYTLQADGRTRDIVVVGQSEPGLPVSKAIEQLKKTKFDPLIENGAPVEKAHQVITIH